MSKRRAYAIIILYMLGSSIIYMGQYPHPHLGLCLAYLAFLPIMSFFYQGLDNIFIRLKGILGKVARGLLIILAFLLGGEGFFEYTDLVKSTALFMQNSVLLVVLLMLIMWIIVRKGVEVFSRISFVGLFIVLFLLILLLILGLGSYELLAILPLIPVYYDGLIKNTIFFFVRSFLELFFVMNIITKIKLFRPVSIGFGILLIMNLMMLFLLGDKFITLLNYPFYTSLSAIDYMPFFNRIEILGIIIFYFSIIVRQGVLVFFIKDGLESFNLRPSYFVIVLGILCVSFLAKNSIEMISMSWFYTIIGGILLLIVSFMLKKNSKQ